MSFNRIKNKQAGFTLIELVVVILLTGVLVAAITPFVHTNVKAFVQIRVAKDIAQGARVGLLRMTEELKRATSITNSSSNSIRFNFLDTDGSTRNIIYEYQGEFLTRGDDEAIIAAVQDFRLQYYDESGSSTTTTTAIRLIQIEIDIGASSSQSATIRTCVRPRNI